MENFNTFIEETARQGATDLLFKKKIEDRIKNHFNDAIEMNRHRMFPDDPASTVYDHFDIKSYLALGDLIATYHRWDAGSIVGSFVSALTEANFGDFAAKMQEDFNSYCEDSEEESDG